MANNRRRLMGRVVSDKMDKTVVVSIERRQVHRLYKKVVTVRKRVMAHDESNEIGVGTLVRIVESRPISKRKRWVVESVIEEVKHDLDAGITVQDELAEVLGEDEPAAEVEDTAEMVVTAEVDDTAADEAAEVDEADAESNDDAEAQDAEDSEDAEDDSDADDEEEAEA